MNVFRGAIFDLDGTLLDSTGIWETVDREFLNQRGIALTDGFFQAIYAMEFREAAAYTKDQFCLQESIPEILLTWEGMAVAEYTKVCLKPYAKAYLEKLKASGVQLGIATSLVEKFLVPALLSNGILDWFDCIATTEEAGAGKECSRVYMLAAEKMQLQPHECIVFEDSFLGALSAKRCGMSVAAVFDERAKGQFEQMKGFADYSMKDFNEAPELKM